MHKKVIVLKIKSGKLAKWKQWCSELDEARRTEALETLREEGVNEELCVLIDIGGIPYVVAFSDGEMLSADMTRDINQKHNALKNECLQYIGEGESLYHLSDC